MARSCERTTATCCCDKAPYVCTGLGFEVRSLGRASGLAAASALARDGSGAARQALAQALRTEPVTENVRT